MHLRVQRSRDLELSFARPGALGLLALAAPAAIVARYGQHLVASTPRFHVLAVGATMAVAIAAAVTLTRVGTRRGDVRAVVVGTAFAAMASLLLVHALSTPGIIVGPYEFGLVAFAGGA